MAQYDLTRKPSSLTDQVEELGAAVSAGLMTAERATQHLLEFSDGGLTRQGAGDLLARWQTARAAYAETRMNAEMGIAAIKAKMSGQEPGA